MRQKTKIVLTGLLTGLGLLFAASGQEADEGNDYEINITLDKAGERGRQHDIVVIEDDNDDPLRYVLVKFYPYDEKVTTKEERKKDKTALSDSDLTFHFSNGFNDKLMLIAIEGKTVSGKSVVWKWTERITTTIASEEKHKNDYTFIPHFAERMPFLTKTERDRCKCRSPRLCRYADLSRDCYAKSKVI